MNLQVFVVAKDASLTIRRVVESVLWAPSVAVIDLRSSDDTAKIAKECGADVVVWTGEIPPFVEEIRRRLLETTSASWVLFVDQDEEHIGTEQAIRQHIEDNQEGALAFPLRNFMFGRSQRGVFAAARLVPATLELPTSMHQPIKALVVSDRGGYIAHHAIVAWRPWVSKWRRYASVEAGYLASSAWTFSIGRDLLKAPVAQVWQTWRVERGPLVWALHASFWVMARAFMAVRLRRSLRPLSLGGLRCRPWGWGEQLPSGYLNGTHGQPPGAGGTSAGSRRGRSASPRRRERG